MASITFWNRLEPRPRSNDLSNALAARVRDPAWFLARQWQLGELTGEDAGSPAYLRLTADIAPVVGWDAGEETKRSIDPRAQPLERAVTQELFSPDDLSSRIELGQMFEYFLTFGGVSSVRNSYRAQYPVPQAENDDPHAARLRTLWSGRAVDGLAVYLAAKASLPVLPPPAVPPAMAPRVRTALQSLVTWVEQVFGGFEAADPPAWQPERLEYGARIYAGDPAGGVVSFDADPGRRAELEWYAFDQKMVPPPSGVSAPPVEQRVETVIPAPMRFRGMPNARFWDFEDGRVDFGGLEPDRRDLARMILMDFMLVHGNDWFIVPFDQPVGTLTRSAISVVDVFGGEHAVPRADSSPGPRWSMFSTARDDGQLAPWFLLPASVAEAVHDSAPIEDVRFLRDETANLVWAVERETESHLGAPHPGNERGSPSLPLPQTSNAPLVWRVQTEVPFNWIPFQPVQLDATSGEVALERSSLMAAGAPPGAAPIAPAPWGKVLQPSSVSGRYRVREEEVPREGARVTRVIRWSRWIDGSTHVWIARQRGLGGGEGSSGLRFDLAIDQSL
jgi:hypothetical protein